MNNLSQDLPNNIAGLNTNLFAPTSSNLVNQTDQVVQNIAKRKFCEITDDNLDTGLRGIPVGYCTTSHVDPQVGLSYAGHPISELAKLKPEEVIYLLTHGEMGSRDKIQKLAEDLNERSFAVTNVFEEISKLPKHMKPLKLFNMALQLYGIPFESQEKIDYRNDCLQAISISPVLAAAVINHVEGGRSVPHLSNPGSGYIENFVHLIHPIINFEKKRLIEVLELFAVLHFDHGGGNLSTFVATSTASGLEGMYGSLAAGMIALSGPRHGGANFEALKFLQKMEGAIGDNPSDEQVQGFVRKTLQSEKFVPGFGHAVLRVEDPRATILYDYAKEHFSDHPLVKLAFLVRKNGPIVLKENPKISDPYPNIDAISGVLLHIVGFKTDYFPLLFGMSRIVGIANQIVYQRCEAKDGKGTPMMRPKYIYDKGKRQKME